MAQDPDIFNVNMALNPNSNFIVGLNHDPITRGEVNEIALSIVKGLLYRNLSKGSVILISMTPGIERIISEVACFLGGYSFINRLPQCPADEVVDILKKLDIKFILNTDTFKEIISAPKVSDIYDYPELTDSMYIRNTSGTTSESGYMGKYIKASRGFTVASVESNRNANDIDDSNATWLFFGNPYMPYLPRTLQTFMLNGGGSVINNNPEAITPDTLIEICDKFNPTRMLYMRNIQDGHPDRERIVNKNPYLSVGNTERPSANLLAAFDVMSLSKELKTLKISGPSVVKNKIDLISQLETAQPSIKVINSFSHSESVMKFESNYDDTLHNRVFKHGKIKNSNAVRLDATGEMQIHTDYVLNHIDEYSRDLTEDGLWFKTGNMFEVDAEGYLEFINRK